MPKKSDYKKWIWEYERRIADYNRRIENAKKQINKYRTMVRYQEKIEADKIGSIKEIKKATEDYILEKIDNRQHVVKSVQNLFIYKFLLENKYMAATISKELNCSRSTPPKKRIKLNQILQKSSDIKNQYLNYVEEIKKQKFNQ